MRLWNDRLGAALLIGFDGIILPVVMIVFGVCALLLTVYGRRTAFPVNFSQHRQLPIDLRKG